MTNLIDTNVNLLADDGSLLVQKTQEITQDFLDDLKAQRIASAGRPTGDLHKAASIPVVVYERWLRDGYDARLEPITKTLAKLRAEGLDYFITTDKRL